MSPRPTSTSPAPGQRRRGGRDVLAWLRSDKLRAGNTRLAGLIVGMLVAVVTAGAVLWLSHAFGDRVHRTANNVPVSWQRPVVSEDGLVQQSGVKITQVAVTGDGGLVDLRFKVLDPERANAVHDPATPPAVVEEDSGLVVHELFMNHAHAGPYQTGVTYYLVFNNPGNWVHHGSRVSVMLGNAQVEHVLVP